jgi:DNA-binding CsgD family transcriptional regulator
MPASPPAAARTVRRGSVRAALSMMNAVDDAPADAVGRKRKLVADLCRMLGQQLGDAYVTASPGPESRHAAEPPGAVSLSPRVHQTLERLLMGDSEKEIAARLGVSPHTIHVYVKTLYRRFDVCSRGELLARFVRRA